MLTLNQVKIVQGAFSLAAHLKIEPQKNYAVIGPSGAGKSTLLGAMAGFVPVTHGNVRWGTKDITEHPPGDRPMTMLFQDNNLFPHLSVLQNVGLGIRPTLRLKRAEMEKVRHALERVGLGDQMAKRPGALSGGQQSRAALARVMVQARPFLLLDEPFAALGPALRHEMLDLVHDLVSETQATLVMVTHAPDDARRIADEVIFVADGRAHAPEPTAGLMDNPPPALKAYLG